MSYPPIIYILFFRFDGALERVQVALVVEHMKNSQELESRESYQTWGSWIERKEATPTTVNRGEPAIDRVFLATKNSAGKS